MKAEFHKTASEQKNTRPSVCQFKLDQNYVKQQENDDKTQQIDRMSDEEKNQGFGMV